MKRFAKPRDIKVGVIGYSSAFRMGQIHLHDMQTAGMTPIAVAEIDPKALATAAEDFPGIETYASVTEMLRKSAVDLVAIITPHNTHAKLAVQCLRAGRHVVVEKPMAITTAECDAMIAAARKSGAMLSAYHNRHWDGCILRAIKEIRRGAIGEVVRVEAHMGRHSQPREWWRSSKSISGGILYDWGVHLLEYTLQVLDAKIVEVSGFARTGHWAATSRWKADANEDEALAVVRFDSGTWASLCMTSIDANPKPHAIEITGTKGSYLFDSRGWKTVLPKGDRLVTTTGSNPDSQWAKYYANIADHLTNGTPLVITAEWSRRPIHILDLAGRSAAQGRALRAKYP